MSLFSETITICVDDSDSDLVYLPHDGGDSILPSIKLSDYSTITGIGDVARIGVSTFNTSTPELTLGSTIISEEKLKDLLTLLDMIENMPDHSGIKKLFNSHKAAKKLGYTE